MAKPALVADCFRSMQAAVSVPVTVKTRIGIDDHDSYDFLRRFVEPLVESGCRTFIVHARVAILEGLSPKENRTIPPLKYERVLRLKSDYPELEIILNGGLQTLDEVTNALESFDGVMIGRQAYHDPYFLARIEHHLDQHFALPDRHAIIESMLPYIDRQLAEGERLGRISRHLLGLFAGQPGARAWRRYLSEQAFREGAGVDVITTALEAMPEAA